MVAQNWRGWGGRNPQSKGACVPRPRLVLPGGPFMSASCSCSCSCSWGCKCPLRTARQCPRFNMLGQSTGGGWWWWWWWWWWWGGCDVFIEQKGTRSWSAGASVAAGQNERTQRNGEKRNERGRASRADEWGEGDRWRWRWWQRSQWRQWSQWWGYPVATWNAAGPQSRRSSRAVRARVHVAPAACQRAATADLATECTTARRLSPTLWFGAPTKERRSELLFFGAPAKSRRPWASPRGPRRIATGVGLPHLSL